MFFLIAIIYLAFISLGLPDSLMGSAWPAMHKALDVPISYMGIVSTVVIVCTIISSLLSSRVIKKFGTGAVTAVSVLLSAIGLFGYSASNSLAMLCVWAVPYGLGAGSIDAALNNYVAINLKSRHMNWLHCFWGVGTIIGPYIMGACLSDSGNWQGGYRIVSLIQAAIAVLMFISIPMWKKHSKTGAAVAEDKVSCKITDTLKTKGVLFMLLTFFGYTALEAATGAWASSYLCDFKGISEDNAAKFAALFFLGITFGRLVCGFISDALGDKKLIILGFIGIISGIVLIMLPVKTDLCALCGLAVIGIGCAPIYPSLVHSVPSFFGVEKSQSVIGLVMASAYAGAAVIPPLFGIIAAKTSLVIFPLYILASVLITIVFFVLLYRTLTASPKNIT